VLLLSIGSALSEADELLSGEELSLAALVSSEPQALRVTARVEAEASRRPRVRVLFTFDVLLGRRLHGLTRPVRGVGRGVCGRVAETGSGDGGLPCRRTPVGRDR
jgi:hypothetical protein